MRVKCVKVVSDVYFKLSTAMSAAAPPKFRATLWIQQGIVSPAEQLEAGACSWKPSEPDTRDDKDPLMSESQSCHTFPPTDSVDKTVTDSVFTPGDEAAFYLFLQTLNNEL